MHCFKSCKLRETDIKAYHDSELSEFRIKYRYIVAGSKGVGFFESLSAFNIYVEEVHLSVPGDLLTFSVEYETGIVYLSVFFLRNGAADDPDVVFCSCSRERLPRFSSFWLFIRNK